MNYLKIITMPLLPEHLIIASHPPKPTHGMRTGKEPKGVRIEHEPTGSAVECIKFRFQYQNKKAALAVLELLVEA